VVHVEGDPRSSDQSRHALSEGCFSPTGYFERTAPAEAAGTPPGGTDWEDISWDDALNEIAAKVKKLAERSFIGRTLRGHTVNRCESIAWSGGCDGHQ